MEIGERMDGHHIITPICHYKVTHERKEHMDLRIIRTSVEDIISVHPYLLPSCLGIREIDVSDFGVM